MNIPVDFRGFVVPSGFTLDSYSTESPIETLCRLLLSYVGKDVELGYEIFPDGLKEASLIVPANSIDCLFLGIDRTLCDYAWLDVSDHGFYVIQRIVLGNESISQVEKKIVV